MGDWPHIGSFGNRHAVSGAVVGNGPDPKYVRVGLPRNIVSPTTSPHGSPTLSGGTTPGGRSGIVVVVDVVAVDSPVPGEVAPVPGSVVTGANVAVGPCGSPGATSAPATHAEAMMERAATRSNRRRIVCECRKQSFFCRLLSRRMLLACDRSLPASNPSSRRRDASPWPIPS
jgi:hypothetical protein